MDFLMMKIRFSAPPALDQQWTLICKWHGRNPLTHPVLTLQPSGVFFTHGELWALHWGPQCPCSELSRSCLNGILIVSCFCVVVFFSCLFPLWSVPSLHLRRCLSWHLPRHCQTKWDFFLSGLHDEGDIQSCLQWWANRHQWGESRR